jgi:hypothetical protein
MLNKYMLRLLALIIVFASISCTKMETRKPMTTNGSKPGIVTDVTIVNGKGTAAISYTLPKDEDLQYIMAEYNVNKTVKRQAKVSRYDNKIIVDGFNNKGAYDVTLYSVNSSEIKSDPLIVKVDVDTPDFRIVHAKVHLQEDFGGVSITTVNPSRASIAVVLITKNTNNEFYPVETFYTATDSIRFAVRGYNTDKRLFGIYVRDKFDNYSDTLFQELSPLEEVKLDKTKFRPYILPGDIRAEYGWVLTNLWDENLGSGFHSPEPVDLPGQITFDLGVTAKLSRFKLWHRDDGLYYAWGNPRIWSMWGSNNPDPSGNYNGWEKLMDCESRKPSGSPVGTNTADDLNYIKQGEEFTFPIAAPAVRYIRMQFFESWSASPRIHFMEVTFWGTPN